MKIDVQQAPEYEIVPYISIGGYEGAEKQFLQRESPNLEACIKTNDPHTLAIARFFLIVGFSSGYGQGAADALLEYTGKVISEVGGMQLEEKLDKLTESVSALTASVTGIGAKLDGVKDTVAELKVNNAKVPVIESTVNDIKDRLEKHMDKMESRSQWWKQYLLCPIITGVIVYILCRLF